MKKLTILLYLISSTCLYSQLSKEVNLGFTTPSSITYFNNSNSQAFVCGKKVKLYRSGILISILKLYNSKINSIDINSDEEKALVTYKNGFLVVWNLKTQQPESELFFEGSGLIISSYFMDNLILVHSSKGLEIYDEKGISKARYIYKVKSPVISLSSDRQRIILQTMKGIEILDHRLKSLDFFPISLEHITCIIQDHKKGNIALGTRSGKVLLLNLQNKEHEEILDTKARINDLEFTNDDQYLAIASESLYLISLDPNHHDVVYRDLLGAAYDIALNRNGKELCVLEDQSPYAKYYDISELNIPSRLNIQNEKDIIAPQIYISNPPKILNEKISFGKDIIDIQGAVFDDYGIHNLKINGISTPISNNGRFIVNLPLVIGENEIEIESSDINGNVSIKRFTIDRWTDEKNYESINSKNYLFAIGIDEYRYWSSLNNAVKDINDISQLLMMNYNFNFSEVTVLKNEQASKENIYNGLRSLIEKIGPQDNLVIYFSGHGYFDELMKEGYWVPYEARLNNASAYISNSSLFKIIENLQAQHVFLIADACFSGSLFSTNRGMNSNYTDKLDRFRSRWGLASGRLEVVSDGVPQSNSPFALYLLGFLREHPKDEFAVSELIQYVKLRVAQNSSQTPLGSPLKLKQDEGGEFIFRRRKEVSAFID